MKNSKTYSQEVRATIDQINAAEQQDVSDDENPAYLFSTASSALLAAIVAGKLDPVALARIQLANRGQVPAPGGGVISTTFSRAESALLEGGKP